MHAVTHHSVIGPTRLLPIASVPQVVVIGKPVYPVANGDYDPQESNHIHGQTHSHLGKISSTTLGELLRKKERLRATT